MQTQPKKIFFPRKMLHLASALCVALTIYGCSSTKEGATEEQAMTPEQQQLFILDKVESWSAAEPDIQRVLALEADMQLIINQLASMSELDDNPITLDKPSTALYNTETTLSKEVIPEKNKPGTSKSNPVTTYPSHKTKGRLITPNSSGHYFPKVGIHIAMFKDINTIPLGWQYLQSILPVALLNKKPLLSKIKYEGSEYYSLRIGPLKSANTAKKACISLQQQQHYCSVVKYKGNSFVSTPK